MKIRFNRTALQDALSMVTSVIPSRTPKPILQCLKIVAEKDVVRISATDMEAGITYTISQVEVDKPGQAVIPADKFTSIVRESFDEVIEIETDENAAHIKGSDSFFTIFTQDTAQYPAIPEFDGAADLEVSLDRLQEAILQTVFSAAKESTRYALNGILWEVQGKKLSLVATDGRRLAKSTLSLEKTPKEPQGRIIAPCKTMALLEKIPARDKATVAVQFSGNHIMIACDPVVISSNLVEGNFPKYEDIIPKDYDKKLTLPKDAFLSAVRRAALLASEDSKGIKVSLKKNNMVITSRAPETGDAQIDMAVEYEQDPIEIGFNPQYLVDVLRIVKGGDLEMHLGQSDRPGLFKIGTGFLYIVMPVNL
jgi:DNA polymerase-3 subunit beta